MHFDSNTILPTVQLLLSGIVLPALLGWLVKHSGTAKEHARTAALQAIAEGVAGMVIANNPANRWAQLLAETVKQLRIAPATPTANSEALTRAATAALIKLGAKPPTS